MDDSRAPLQPGEQIFQRKHPEGLEKGQQDSLWLEIAQTSILIETFFGPAPTPFISGRMAPFSIKPRNPEIILSITFDDSLVPFTASSEIVAERSGGDLLFCAPQYRLQLSLSPGAVTRGTVVCRGSFEQILGALRLALAHHLVFTGRGFLLHASCVLVGDTAHLFPGPSGTGKSTAISRAPGTILADEITALTVSPGGILRASGTPFGNRLQPSSLHCPQLIIHKIVHAQENRALPTTAGRIVSILLESLVFSPTDDAEGQIILDLLMKIIDGCSYDILHLRADGSFWRPYLPTGETK
ncbi:hypothetical protein KKF84_10260 [Myxococcota bacterium]|nr:hypothetical protein [Myxococcota bacterium]MBU1535694.1 hypothetical protein [Myxococcota bacterium]